MGGTGELGLVGSVEEAATTGLKRATETVIRPRLRDGAVVNRCLGRPRVNNRAVEMFEVCNGRQQCAELMLPKNECSISDNLLIISGYNAQEISR